MSKLLRDLEIQEANALSIARFCREQIEKQNKPEKKADPKIVAAREQAKRNAEKRYAKHL